MLAFFIISLLNSNGLKSTDGNYQICYGCESSETGYDRITSNEADIASFHSLIPADALSVSLTFRKYPTTVLDLSKDDYSTKQIELIGKGKEYYIKGLQLSLGAVQTLILNSLHFSIVENFKVDHIGKLISFDSFLSEGSINYNLVDELNISVQDFDYFGPKTGYQNKICIHSDKDRSEVQYLNSSWDIESYSNYYGRTKVSLKVSDFLNSELLVSAPQLTLTRKMDDPKSIPITVASKSIKFIIGSGWECIGSQPVKLFSDIVNVETKSFVFPFTIPVSSYEIVSTSNIFINCLKVLRDITITVSNDPWYFGEIMASGKSFTFIGTISIIKGYGFIGLFFETFKLNPDSNVNLPATTLGKELSLAKGSKLTMNDKLSANQIKIDWDVEKFPIIDMKTNDINVSTIIVRYRGLAKDNYDFLNGKQFDIIKSSKCEDLKNKVTFVSKIPEFNGATSALSTSCNAQGTLQIVGPALASNTIKAKSLKSKLMSTISEIKTPTIVGVAAASSSIVILVIAFIIKSI